MNIFFFRLFGIDYKYVLNYDLIEIDKEEREKAAAKTPRRRRDGYTETLSSETNTTSMNMNVNVNVKTNATNDLELTEIASKNSNSPTKKNAVFIAVVDNHHDRIITRWNVNVEQQQFWYQQWCQSDLAATHTHLGWNIVHIAVAITIIGAIGVVIVPAGRPGFVDFLVQICSLQRSPPLPPTLFDALLDGPLASEFDWSRRLFLQHDDALHLCANPPKRMATTIFCHCRPEDLRPHSPAVFLYPTYWDQPNAASNSLCRRLLRRCHVLSFKGLFRLGDACPPGGTLSLPGTFGDTQHCGSVLVCGAPVSDPGTTMPDHAQSW